MTTRNPLPSLLLLGLLSATPLRAGDFQTEEFALRFSAALSRLSTYPDVAAQGGSSVASLRSTSINPAALAWRPIYRTSENDPKTGPTNSKAAPFYNYAASAQYNGISFDRGLDMWAATESFAFQSAANWAVKFSASQLRSNEGEMRPDGKMRPATLFEFDINVFRLDLARRFETEKFPFSLGVQLSYSQSETNV